MLYSINPFQACFYSLLPETFYLLCLKIREALSLLASVGAHFRTHELQANAFPSFVLGYSQNVETMPKGAYLIELPSGCSYCCERNRPRFAHFHTIAGRRFSRWDKSAAAMLLELRPQHGVAMQISVGRDSRPHWNANFLRRNLGTYFSQTHVAKFVSIDMKYEIYDA